MVFPISIFTLFFTLFCASVLLSACDSGSNAEGDNGLLVLPLENTPTPMLDAQQLDILDKIKKRSSDDGALYQFEELNPVFVQDGDKITVNFTFINPNTLGGTPIVEYSLNQRAITSIVYTQ